MPEEKSSQEILAQISERLDHLEGAVRQQIARIYAIEQRLGLVPPPVKQLQTSARKVIETDPIESQTTPAEPQLIEKLLAPLSTDNRNTTVEDNISSGSESAENANQPLPSGSGRSRRDLETLIGGTWFNRIGIFAIILGVGYFLREAFRLGWIGPQGRVIIGIAIGIGLLVAGERIRLRGFRSYAQSLSGGGIAILYLSFFAAFARYGLIGQPSAFSLMSLVTATAVLLAARSDALVIAILGLIGGFLTPILLSTGKDNETGLFTYIALLDAGVLALAYFKQWRVLNYLAFGATVLLAASWMLQWYAPEKLWLTIFFFTLFLLIFAMLPVLHNVINRRPTHPLDLVLIFANASVYFATCYSLLEMEYRPYLGLFAVLMAGFYLGLGYFTYRRDQEDSYLILTFIGLATIFLTVALPIQFDQHWVTIGWAVEGAVLTWIGLRTGNRATRYMAVFVFSIALWHWFTIDLGEFVLNQATSFIPIFNRRGVSALVLVASLVMTARLYRRYSQTINAEERKGFDAVCILAANFVALVWMSADVQEYFNQSIARLPDKLTNDPSGFEPERLENTKAFTLSLLWNIYGIVALIIGISHRSQALRFGALVLLSLAAMKMLVFDLHFYAAPWHMPLFNQTFGAVALLVAVSAIAIRFYAKGEGIGEKERKAVLAALTIAVNLFAITGLSAEALGHFESQIRAGGIFSDDLQDLLLAKRLSLSVIWAIYGGALLVVGIWRNIRLLRVMALILLTITIGKVFLSDLASLDKIYRIISFIVLGVILLTVSFLYQQWQSRKPEQGQGLG